MEYRPDVLPATAYKSCEESAMLQVDLLFCPQLRQPSAMATSAIRARISAFESMSQTPSLPVAVGPRKPPIKLVDTDEQRRIAPPSILDSSSPPASSSLVAHQPIAPIASRSPSPAASAVSDFVNVSPPHSMPPPLPPRRTSGNFSASSSSSPGPPRLTTSSSSSSSLLSPTSHSSLTVGGSYPPSRSGKSHAYANSTSSFHSVSLSDTVEELDGSFETLYTPRSMAPAAEPATRPLTSPGPLHAPVLPPRPGSSIVPITPTPMPYAVRSKPPPLPPPKYSTTHKRMSPWLSSIVRSDKFHSWPGRHFQARHSKSRSSLFAIFFDIHQFHVIKSSALGSLAAIYGHTPSPTIAIRRKTPI